MIDAPHLKSHRTASSMDLKIGRCRLIGRTKGELNSKLHAIAETAGRPLTIFLTAGLRSKYIDAQALLDGLPPTRHKLVDRGYDANWYREALEDMGIAPFIASRKGRKVTIPHVETRNRKRHKVKNSFDRFKDLRKIVTRYDRYLKVFLSACTLAAVVVFWS